MLRANVFTLATIVVPSFASALPTASTNICSPDFQHHLQSIFVRPELIDRAAFEWRPDSTNPGAHVQLQLHNLQDTLSQGEFLVESTGQPNGSFKITVDPNQHLVLTVGSSGDLTLDTPSSPFTPAQEFTIMCTSCFSSGAGAETCTIKHPASGKCIAGSADGETLHFRSCNSAGVYSFSDGTLV